MLSTWGVGPAGNAGVNFRKLCRVQGVGPADKVGESAGQHRVRGSGPNRGSGLVMQRSAGYAGAGGGQAGDTQTGT